MILKFQNFFDFLSSVKSVSFFIFGFLVCLLFNQGVNIYFQQLDKNLPDEYNQELEKAILWLKENSEPDDIVLSEWTQGHQIVALAKRRVVATSKVYPSEAVVASERYKDIARFFFADSEENALEIVKKYQAVFIFVRKNFDWWTCGSIGKCNNIAGTIIDRIIKRDKLNHLEVIFQSSNFQILKIRGNGEREVYAGFPEDYFSKIVDSGKNSFLSKIDDRFLIYGAVLPHHLFYVHPLLAEFFKNLAARQNIKTFILLGPDHYNIAKSSIVVTDYYWETPWGKVRPDAEIIEAITLAGAAVIDNEINEREHSLKVFVPFIKYHFPDSRIVPVIIKDSTEDIEVLKLVESIKRFVGPSVPIIVSADFAHRLSFERTLQEDRLSLATIKNFDFSEVKNLEADAKPALLLLLKLMKELNCVNVNILKHTNNLDILKEGIIQTEENTIPYLVSYFFIVFGK